MLRGIDMRRHAGNERDDIVVIAFDGDADLVGVAPLREALAQVVAEGGGPVVVDLGGATFIDSSGISTLLNGLRRLTRQGRRMAVVADDPVIVRPLELAHVGETLRLCPTVDAALASL